MNRRSHGLDESAPIAQVARFDAWNSLNNFDMAYLPANDDYLKWSLTDDYKRPIHGVPFINGIDGPLYGRNTIPIQNLIQCNPFVNSCTHQKTRVGSQLMSNY